MNIQYSIEKEQNVTFLYLKRQIHLMKGAKEFIDCMELNLFAAANAQKIPLKIDQEKTLLDVLSGRAFSIPIFSYFYGSTCAIFSLGLFVELYKSIRKKKRSSNTIASVENGEKKSDMELATVNGQSEEMKLVLQGLRGIKETLQQMGLKQSNEKFASH